jgi:hypothetical protein
MYDYLYLYTDVDIFYTKKLVLGMEEIRFTHTVTYRWQNDKKMSDVTGISPISIDKLPNRPNGFNRNSEMWLALLRRSTKHLF